MTEKNYNPNQKEKKAMKKQESITKKTVKSKKEDKKLDRVKEKVEENKEEKNPNEVEKKPENQEKIENQKKDEKKEELTKKDYAIVNVYNLPISLKQSKEICRFIKGKRIGDAIRELKEVQNKRKAIPMRGEIPHRKGIMSGRYPVKASKYFISALKTLLGNSNYNKIEDPIIAEAIANFGSRPYGRFGRVRKKRTNIRLISKENVKTDGEKNGRKKSN